MKREEFCEVLGDINENYVKEAGANPKAEKRRRFKWKVIAACLCLLLAAPLTVFAMDTIQYHAAVDYLRSLGIPVEDLSDYSRTEIKEAVKTMDAGGRRQGALHVLVPDQIFQRCLADQAFFWMQIDHSSLIRSAGSHAAAQSRRPPQYAVGKCSFS